MTIVDILSQRPSTGDDFKSALEDARLEDLLVSIEERAAARDKTAFNAIRSEIHERNGWGGCPCVIEPFDEYLAKRERSQAEQAREHYTFEHASPLGRASMLADGYRPLTGVPTPRTAISPMKTPQENTAGASAPIQLIKVSDIVPDPNNRKDHDAEELSTLAASIERDGLLQPIVVRPIDGGKFMLIAGERRWCAHRLLKRQTIEARVSTAAGGAESTRKRLAENFHRVDLSPIEKARDLAKLEADGLSQKEIAAFVGAKDQSTVSNFIRLLKLPKSVQAKVHAGELTAAHAKAIARFDRWPAVCEVIAGKVIQRNTPSKEIEQGVPFDYELENKKLIVRIDTAKPYSWSPRPQYQVPPDLQKDPDFLKTSADSWVCFAPAKWAPVKAKQDADFAEQQKKAQQREGAKQSKMSPKEKAERAKKIAENKRNREQTAAQLTLAVTKLRNAKGFEPMAVQVLAETAFGYRYSGQLEAAAKLVGIPAPKGLQNKWGGPDCEKLRALAPEKVVKLVVAAIMLREAHDATRNGFPVPASIALVAGKAKKGGK